MLTAAAPARTTTLPGFVAEASLGRAANRYRHAAASRRARASHEVIPADYIDPGCFDACEGSCHAGCAELVGSARGACLRRCSADVGGCISLCTYPGEPPPGYTPPRPTTLAEDLIVRGHECFLCCTEGANSWFEQNVMAGLCMQFCLVMGCNR